jgi:hypothetical protein
MAAEVLLQALERVVASLDVTHFVRIAVAFAATPQDAFVVIGTRVLPTHRGGTSEKIFRIFSANHGDMDSMWRLATLQLQEWQFLTLDGPALMNCITALGHNPAFCRVQLLDWSQSRVYAVALPLLVSFPEGTTPDVEDVDESAQPPKTFPGIPADQFSFVVKVVSDPQAFQREDTALRAVAPVWESETKTAFYALGSLNFSAPQSPVAWFGNAQIPPVSPEVQNRLPNPNTSAWWNHTPPSPTTGGAFFLRKGDPLPSSSSPKDILDQVILCLNVVHKAGICHRDLRKANMVCLDGVIQLVDFGESAKLDTEEVPSRSAARKPILPLAVRNLSDNLKYSWTKANDIEMLARELLKE